MIDSLPYITTDKEEETRQKGRISQTLKGLLWALIDIVTIALALVAIARLVAYDQSRYFVVLNTMTLYLYLPAYLILPLTLWARRWVIVSLTALVVGCHLLWVLPSYASAEKVPASALLNPQIRVYSANVFFKNTTTERLLTEIEQSQADVVLLQEVTPLWDTALKESDWIAQYPYQVDKTQSNAFGSQVLSKYPLINTDIWWNGEVYMIRTTVNVNGIPVRMYNVHTLPPTHYTSEGALPFSRWQDQMAELVVELNKESGAVLAMGDFNVSQHNHWYQALKESGFFNAHEFLGRGQATTWPNQSDMGWVRLDHAFLSSDLVALSIVEGKPTGSDHKSLILDMALLNN